MDFTNVTQVIIEYIEEDYILNREKIISELYVFLSNEKSKDIIKFYEGYYISQDNKQRFVQIFDRLKKIQSMIELDSDINEILAELEIIEILTNYLQKYMSRELKERPREASMVMFSDECNVKSGVKN